ncbi:uncharacterized protein SPAPADRAFT_71368 [Spathaspora passalidarum NRRL Y-27907]|uniref:Transcription factor IIIC 90kDa subunit N-terminal domain-containing protein n=1 Tax=Spathaspora passalidarum (strain NRRL Y-27907 / 11-Y1) TaxID=619300 RepID=G3AK79_SPAPN|nr:uncharacterized protein SPAPADRAFT_71368 [Spathaspora passalidarum NRRL Y-27907]EGW33536.1 hypothetical protein SPAPADRAFT_71368 [Spathaspora passalidarum NRRL Y-27907]
MSLIKPLRLIRVDASLSQNDPLQWSENSQLALNGYNQITLLEPKLPSLHQAIRKVNDVTVLDPKHLFQLTTILDRDSIKSMPLGNFNDIVVLTGDEPVNISNVVDYIIVSHQWTPTSDTSRDNLLGVLFNSGELLIIGRKNTQSNKYFVLVEMFDVLADQVGITDDGKKHHVDSNQLFSLKVKSFHFSSIGPLLLLSIVNGNNTLFVYKVDRDTYGLELLASIDNGFKIIKQKWSNWKGNASYITVISPENSLRTFKLTYEDDKLQIFEPTLVFQPTRFRISQLEYIYYQDDQLLVTTLTGKLVIIDSNHQAYTHSFDNYTTCVSVTTGIIGTVLTLILAFENSAFVTVKFDLDKHVFESIPTDKSLTSFVETVLSTYQLENMAEEDEEGEGGSGSEGLLVVQGVKLFHNNILSVQYKTNPKNSLIYRQQAQLESHLQFIQLETPIQEPVQASTNQTSIAKVVEYWFENFAKIPEFHDDIDQERTERIEKFVEKLEEFKKANIVDIDLELDSEKFADFSLLLLTKFNKNVQVNQLQYQHTLSRLLINSLIIFKEGNSKLTAFLEQLKNDIKDIENKLSSYLKKLIFKYIDDNNIEPSNEFDKYLLISNLQQLRELGIEVTTKVPENCNITMGTKFYSETFEVHVKDVIPHDRLVCSTTDHGWSVCALSNLPLLQMNNRRDELAQFHYIIPEEEFGGLINDLLQTVNYCYISGNKTYQLK